MTKVEDFVKLYESGLTIREISEKNKLSYESVRKILKGRVSWKRRYLSDFTNEENLEVLKLFDDGYSVKEIAKKYMISAPAISRLLIANNRKPDSSAKRYDILRELPISRKQQEFIVGHLLGDGCLYRDGKNSLYKISISQQKKHEEYFHWKRVMLDPFINTWRENVDKRGNSIMLNATTICHKGLTKFANMFYDKDRIKHVPENVGYYLTPLALAVWVMDDGNLNGGVNMRLATHSFTYEENIQLQAVLKGCLDLRSKVMGFKFKGKQYWQLTFNKENTQKLSDMIRPYIVDCMKYKLMPESSTTTCRTSEKDDDIV